VVRAAKMLRSHRDSNLEAHVSVVIQQSKPRGPSLQIAVYMQCSSKGQGHLAVAWKVQLYSTLVGAFTSYTYSLLTGYILHRRNRAEL